MHVSKITSDPPKIGQEFDFFFEIIEIFTLNSRTSPLYCFRLFPILIGTIVGIIVCVIFTVTDTFPEDDASRTDNDRASQGIAEAPWIFFPYPCKY